MGPAWAVVAVVAVALAAAGSAGWRWLRLRAELRRLAAEVPALAERARHGARLALDRPDAALGDLVAAVNRQVDDYESRLLAAAKLEAGVRLAVAGIAHDLRTPLTSLTGYLHLLRGAEEPAQRARYLAAVADSVAALGALNDSFYDLARLEWDGEPLTLARVDLRRAVHEALFRHVDDLDRAGLAVVFAAADDDTPVWAEADAVALERVLENLVQNVLRHGRDAVTVSFGERGDRVTVTLANTADHGPPPDLERLFERFTTTDPARREGLGLGLVHRPSPGRGDGRTPDGGVVGASVERDTGTGRGVPAVTGTDRPVTCRRLIRRVAVET